MDVTVLLQGAVCGSVVKEPGQQAPRAGHAHTAKQPIQQRVGAKGQGQSQPQLSAADGDEKARRRAERAAAAEQRARAQQNRGKSSTGAGRTSNGNSLYGELNGDGTPASRRARSQWEIDNQEALGATIIHTNEKA